MKALSIGRNVDCNIVLEDPAVSRLHAVLRIYPTGKYEIISSGTNGTKVNGNQIASNVPYPLKRGDSVVFANTTRLDWARVPNPLRPLKIGAIVLAAILCAGLIIWGVSSLVSTYSAPDSTEQVSDDESKAKTDTLKTDGMDGKIDNKAGSLFDKGDKPLEPVNPGKANPGRRKQAEPKATPKEEAQPAPKVEETPAEPKSEKPDQGGKGVRRRL